MPLYRRVPKRGFTNIHRREYAIVTVKDLERTFNPGDVVSPKELKQTGLVKSMLDGVKILGNGDITKKLHIKANRFSQAAAEKIRAAGGTVEELK